MLPQRVDKILGLVYAKAREYFMLIPGSQFEEGPTGLHRLQLSRIYGSLEVH